jgi:hypothetical protein
MFHKLNRKEVIEMEESLKAKMARLLALEDEGEDMTDEDLGIVCDLASEIAIELLCWLWADEPACGIICRLAR